MQRTKWSARYSALRASIVPVLFCVINSATWLQLQFTFKPKPNRVALVPVSDKKTSDPKEGKSEDPHVPQCIAAHGHVARYELTAIPVTINSGLVVIGVPLPPIRP
jgi:hypothetical protein